MLENGEIKPFKKRTLFRDEIRDYIKGKILSNELKQGDRIVETRWAKVYQDAELSSVIKKRTV